MTAKILRKRGRPPGSKTRVLPDESGPLWAIVDQLQLIHDDLKAVVKLARESNAPARSSCFDTPITKGENCGKTH